MAYLKKAVSLLVSYPSNKFKGTLTTHSPLFTVRKTSSFSEVGARICPSNMIFARFYSTFGIHVLNLPIHRGSNNDKDQKLYEYSHSIGVACRHGLVDDAIQLLDELVGMGCKPTVGLYTVIIDSLFQMGFDDWALTRFRELAFHRSIIPDSPPAYRSMLHCLRILARRDGISKVLKDMEDKGVRVGLTTFNICVDAYCKEGRMDDAESLVNLMTQRRIGPNVNTYKWLIEGYCLLGKMSKSRELFDSHHVPDIDVYHSLLNGYFKDSNVEEAMHLFDKMVKNGVNLNKITYNRIGVFPFESSVAKQDFSSMVPMPDECTFKIVLEGLCNNNQVEEAVSLFNSMGDTKFLSSIDIFFNSVGDDKKLNSNIDIYNILIGGASKHGKLGIARTLYNDLTIKGLEPNAVTYAAMINGFCEEGLAGEAKELFLEMKKKDIPPNDATWDVLLRGFMKIHQHDIVNMLLLEMGRKAHKSDVSKGHKSDVSTFLQTLIFNGSL